MAQRTAQFINDEDLPINNFRIVGIKSLLFNSLAAGTVPVANEVLYAEGFHQVLKALVRTRLQVGDSNQSVMLVKAASESIDTRSRSLSYDGNNRLTTIIESEGAVTVKSTVNTLDGLGRVSESKTLVGGSTVVTTYTYVGNSEKIASISRSVV